MPASMNTPSESDAAGATGEAATVSAEIADPDDDLRRKYREALERKRAGGSAAATGHGADKAAAPTSNDKVQRTFRRRAGG